MSAFPVRPAIRPLPGSRRIARCGGVAALALALLSACSTTINYRPGASTETVRKDELTCEREAYAEAPVRIVRDYVPGQLVRGAPICSAPGQCRPGPVYREPGRWISYDANEDRRSVVVRQCLAARGYQRVTLPNCSDTVRAAVPPAVTITQPALRKGACVIRRGDDRYQIVNGAG